MHHYYLADLFQMPRAIRFQYYFDTSDNAPTAGATAPDAETPVIARVSTGPGRLGAADQERDIRGFALKIRTQEGDRALVGADWPPPCGISGRARARAASRSQRASRTAASRSARCA